jgi:hypothetical protein
MATVRLQLRRGLADDWFDANPTLAAGEIGIETDTNTFKFGDGDTAWNDLEYALSGTVDDYIALSTKGVANGVASLDGSGLIPIAQLPGAAALDAEVSTAVTNHNNSTTNVHGIANTSLLATTANVATAKSEAEATASSELTSHNSNTTNVHGIVNTANLVTLDANQTLTAKTLSSPSLTGTPTAPTASVGTDTTQVATTAFVQDAIEVVVGAAPAALNTLAEIATSLANNADLSGTLTTAISAKVAKSGDTMSGVLNMDTNKITSLATATSDFDAANKLYVDQRTANAVGTHKDTTTEIHGISDTANLVYTGDYRLQDARNPIDLSVTEGKITDLAVTTAKIADLAVTTAKLGDTSVTTIKIADDAITSDKIADNAISQIHLSDDSVGTNEISGLAVTTAKIADSAVTTAKIEDLNITEAKINAAAVTADKIGSLAVTEGKIADGAVSTVKIADSSITTGKIANGTIVDEDINASAAISQSKIDGLGTALDLKAPLADPTFTGTVSGVTKSHVGLANVDNTSDVAKPVSTATQTELDLKAPKADPTFTGTVSGVTKSHVGLGNVDNTTDANKPVSTATQTALDLKAPLASPTFTGDANFESNVTIEGNLVVEGTTTTVNTSEVQIDDPIFYLSANQYDANTRDIGITGAYGTVGGTEANHLHTGLVKDITDGKWKLFSNAPHPVNNVVDFTSADYDTLKVGPLEASSILATSATIGDVSNTELQYLNGVTSAVQTQINSKAPLASPTFTGTVTVAASGVAFTDKTQTKAGVPSLTTIATAVSSNTTLDALGTDAAVRDSLVPLSGAVGITFEATGNAKYAIGSSISFYQSSGTGANFIESGITVLATPGRILRTTNSSVTATKIAATTWLLAGDLR